ncbi:MAG TPA: hypothetical protein VM284_02565 [Candidatus Limnocylindria bacterium]|nr:hypothetical protein [Candidatus Limnocylindria bacterium]
MRIGAIVALALSLLLVSGCISVVEEPTPTPTTAISEPPTAPPTLPPTDPPTPAPSRAPTPTLAPGQTPLPTPLDLLPFLTSGVTLYNLGDTTLFVTATALNADTDEEFKLLDLAIEPEQFTRQAAIPLLLRFDFTYAQDTVDALGSCTMIVSDADEVEFLAAPNGVAVVKNNVQPDDLAEMNVSTSSLCTAGASQ